MPNRSRRTIIRPFSEASHRPAGARGDRVMPGPDQLLGQVQENHTPRERAAVVGPVLREVLASPLIRGPAWRRRLLAVLTEHAGNELLVQAAPVSVRAGVLRFQVHEPALRYQLALQWEQRLLELLRAELPEAGIHTVRFTCGPHS